MKVVKATDLERNFEMKSTYVGCLVNWETKHEPN